MDFNEKVNRFCNKYKLNEYSSFNLLKVMHHLTDERRLHSRFITFLLNPNGSHEQGTKFLELFLNNTSIKSFELQEVSVYPHEVEKKEDENIDIFIQNSKGQAIIIENKIFAGDSNKKEGETIKAQLLNYYDKKKIEFSDITLVYLTLNGKEPSFYEQFKDIQPELIRLDYIGFITKWLEQCLEQTISNSDLRSSILQYLSIVKEITNDFELAVALKEETAKDLESGYKYWIIDKDINNHIVQDQFKHVKWHTVHEFMNTLYITITSKFNTEVSRLNEDHITACTHRNSVKAKVVIAFLYEDTTYYVCNDNKGFTIGCVGDNCQKEYKVLFEGKYNFNDFSIRETFDLINEDITKMLISRIVDEINKYIVK
ncbi:PD-(D/E)XK nuclease family protein [Myroides sp. M-43]|uniref:PDDEXK-like family protein n=1 Tax=Myroides oncorhynchi TaxID=2893756 RepID=UPI001E2BEC17|nr:PD-(D/E)XK nuclease family protein [Myroides oncorhynchi]MCC9043718.1 PD-(D/E)XK nuclease family protein [Myroides oncorhynchi]